MTRLTKWLAISAGIVVLIPVALYVGVWLFFFASNVPSKIADFRPTSFEAKANSKFFYSIGNELKYSDQIDPKAPTLFRGHVDHFLVSPDNKKIAVVADGQLAVVGAESGLWQVTAVASIYRGPKPLGQQFFRDDNFQWSEDSKALYLIRDEYYESKGSQLFSTKGELWKYDLGAGTLQLVLKPFEAFNYFFGKQSGLYYSVPTDRGELRLRYFDGNHVRDIGEPSVSDISTDKLSSNLVESIFYSFSINDYEEGVLPSKRVELVAEGEKGPQRLVIRGQSYLDLTQGEGLKGPYYCSESIRSVFLPGDRYFVFNVPYCGNYNGQLLIDTVTGKYERLPADSVVYLTLNTETYPSFKIGGGGIVIK
jgi:hypothetical protein